MPILSFCRKAIESFSHFLGHVAMWGAFAMMLLVVTDVAMRAVASSSTLIAEEGGGYLMVLIAFLAMAETFKQGRHIRVDIVAKRLPGRLRAWLDVLLPSLGLMVLIVVIWRVIIMVYRSYAGNVIIPGIFLTPVYLPQMLIVIGLVALALQCMLGLSRTFRNLWEKPNKEAGAKMAREVSPK